MSAIGGTFLAELPTGLSPPHPEPKGLLDVTDRGTGILGNGVGGTPIFGNVLRPRRPLKLMHMPGGELSH